MAPLLRVERRLLGSEPSVQTATLKRYMAGAVGFEPTIHGSKPCSLTTWIHPYIGRISLPNILLLLVLAPFLNNETLCDN